MHDAMVAGSWNTPCTRYLFVGHTGLYDAAVLAFPFGSLEFYEVGVIVLFCCK